MVNSVVMISVELRLPVVRSSQHDCNMLFNICICARSTFVCVCLN